MNLSRRTLLKAMGSSGLAAAAGVRAPALAQNLPIRIGVLAPLSGVAGYIGENGLRALRWMVDRTNKQGGIGGRAVEIVVQEETSPKDTIDRFRHLVLRENVDCIQGVVSSGVSLALAPQVEEIQRLTIFWDGTSQDGVRETMPNPRFLFRSTDNECEAVLASLLALKYWKGQFTSIAGMNPDYTYGRNNWAVFLAILKKYNIQINVVAELWSKVGALDFNSQVATLKAAKPDLIFSSLPFADLPVFMRTSQSAGLTQGTKFVLPAAGHQHAQLKKSFTPERIVFCHNNLYFDDPNGSGLMKEFVAHYRATYSDFPHWECDRSIFAFLLYKAAVEAALKSTGKWPDQAAVIDVLEGLKVETLSGPGEMRKDHIPEQTFIGGLTSHDNDYDITTLSNIEHVYSTKLQKRKAGDDFWQWIAATDLSL